MKQALSSEAQNRLRIAGWYPGRVADLTHARKILTGLGISMTENAEELLLELYGLEVTRAYGYEPTKFWYGGAMVLIESRHLSVLRALAGEPVCPIIGATCGVLCLGESGTVHAIDLNWCCFGISPSLDDLLCERKTGKTFIFNEVQLEILCDEHSDIQSICDMIVVRQKPFDLFDVYSMPW